MRRIAISVTIVLTCITAGRTFGQTAADKPCWLTFNCKPDKAQGLSSLQAAWEASATTPDQRQKMVSVISSKTIAGTTDWTKAASEYFAWRGANWTPPPVDYTKPAVSKPAQSKIIVAGDTLTCAKLRQDYEDASKKLALSSAENAVDNSAPRATMRAARDTTTISQAQMTMELMRSNSCKAPNFAPSASRYGLASLRCITAKEGVAATEALDRLNGRYNAYETPAACDTDKWQPD